MIYPIVLFGDPVLRKKGQDIPVGSDIKELVADMFETMKAASGVGLAAPQIGKSLRLFIVDSTPMHEDDENETPLTSAFINPEIIEEDGEEWAFEEGCLSIPGIREDVKRESIVKIKYYDQDWNEHIEEFDDIKARIIQHEYDHIEGVLFTDYVSAFKKKLLKGKLANISKGKVDADYRVKVPSKR
ncbi:MAG: peptide deformylase [Cyclobacteriaceae bacterium]